MNCLIKRTLKPKTLIALLCGAVLSVVAQAETPAPRELEITGKYLLMPIQHPGKEVKVSIMQVEIDGVIAYRFGVFFALGESEV